MGCWMQCGYTPTFKLFLSRSWAKIETHTDNAPSNALPSGGKLPVVDKTLPPDHFYLAKVSSSGQKILEHCLRNSKKSALFFNFLDIFI